MGTCLLLDGSEASETMCPSAATSGTSSRASKSKLKPAGDRLLPEGNEARAVAYTEHTVTIIASLYLFRQQLKIQGWIPTCLSVFSELLCTPARAPGLPPASKDLRPREIIRGQQFQQRDLPADLGR